jgi:hypothetical protein
VLLAVEGVQRVADETASAALPLAGLVRVRVGDEKAPDLLRVTHDDEAAGPGGEPKRGAVLAVRARVPDRVAKERACAKEGPNHGEEANLLDNQD